MPAPLIVSAPVVPSVSPSARPNCRRAVASAIGHYRLVSATTDASETPVLGITALRSDNVPLSRFDGHYVYAPSLDEARRVVDSSYDGATGTIRVDDPFSGNLASADLEITNTLPGTWHLDIKGINQVVNDALSRMRVWARIDFTGNGTFSHSLDDYADWLTSEEMISHLEDRFWGIASTDPTVRSSFDWRVQQNGSELNLITDWAYATDETFTLVAIRPGDKWIRSGGVWAAGNGLQNETDEAAAPLRWVRTWGSALAFRHLIDVTEEDESIGEQRRAARLARYQRRIRSLATACQRIRIEEFPRPLARRTPGLIVAPPPVTWTG